MTTEATTLAAFADLVGQDTAVALLARAVALQRIAPAYLFAGPAGVGRRLAAERFAEVILAAFAKPAAVRPGLRRRVEQRLHPDLFWIEPTYLHQGKRVSAAQANELGLKRRGSAQIRIEQIREIAQFLSRPPLESRRAVVVLDGAETMAEAAANGLLKTLEEPGSATLILLAPELGSLLPTLVSRCQPVPFRRLSPAELAQVLQQCGQSAALAEPAVLSLAQGSPGSAIAAYEQLQAMPPPLLTALQQPPANLRQALERGRQIAQTLEPEAQLWLIDYLQHQFWQQMPHRPDYLSTLEQARQALRSYVQPRLVWEVTFMQMLEPPALA